MARILSSLPLLLTNTTNGLLVFVSATFLLLPLPPAVAKAPANFTSKFKDALNDGDADAALKLLSSPDAKQLSEIQRLRYLNEASAMKGDNKTSLASLNKLISLEPNNSEFLFLRAAIFTSLKEHDNALKDYDKILSLKSRQAPWTLIQRSSVYRTIGKNQLALNDLTEAATHQKVQFEAWRDACNLCVKMGKHKEAISFADRLIKQAPSEASFYIIRAKEHAKLNNIQAASKDLRTAESLAPEDRSDINLIRKELLNLAPTK